MATETNGTEQFASIEDAAKAYTDVKDIEAPEEDNQDAEDEEEGEPAGEGEDPGAETETDDDAQTEGDDDLQASDGGRFVADNAKIKLDDGTVTTIAELKKGTLLHGDWTRKSQALAEDRKAVETQKAQFQSVEAKLQQDSELVSFVASQLLPQEPDPQMIEEGNIIGYQLAEVAYKKHLKAVGQAVAIFQDYQEKTAAEQKSRFVETRKEEAKRLFERAPELATKEKYDAFWGEAVKAGEHYGYTAEQLAARNSHVDYLILRDALAYRRIKAGNGKPNPKVQGKPPVINGDRRRTAGEMQQRTASTAMARLNQTGSVKDGVAALLALEKG